MMRGTDAVFHLAGSYRVGIPESEHVAMYAANVVATRAVLDAAVAAGVPRIVYASTVNVFGDTHAQVVDESYERPSRPRTCPTTTRRSTSPTRPRRSGSRRVLRS